MYNTTHTHEATDTVESVTMGPLIIQQVFTVDTDENGELVQAEVEVVEVTASDGTPVAGPSSLLTGKSLWGNVLHVKQLQAETIAEMVAKAKAEIHAERVAAAEAEGMEETPEGQLTIELAALGVAL